MFQKTTYSQYGNTRSFYGNIQYGLCPKFFHQYGAWPEERPKQEGMLYSDWQESEAPIAIPSYAEEISSRIEIIKRLKQQVEVEQDLKIKNELREQLRIEREAKERAFKLKALVDEEELLFILLN